MKITVTGPLANDPEFVRACAEQVLEGVARFERQRREAAIAKTVREIMAHALKRRIGK